MRCRAEKSRCPHKNCARAAGVFQSHKEMGSHCRFKRRISFGHGVQIPSREIDRQQCKQSGRGSRWQRKRHLDGIPRRSLWASPSSFLGYLFLLEDRDNVKTPVVNKEPYFQVDPEFRGETYTKVPTAIRRYRGVSYSKRYELLCRRLILERLYSASCF